MVQNTPGPGRPLTFARDVVLEEMVRLFWEKGYEGVSLKDLEDRTGLNRSSLYNSFGSKEALFSLALDRYLREVAGRLLVPLEEGEKGMEDIHAFIEAVAAWFSSPASNAGCLMVNSMVEFGGSKEEIVREACHYTDRFRAAASSALTRAIRRGELPEGEVEPRVDLLLGMILALNVAARSGVPGLTGQLVDALRVQVREWAGEASSFGEGDPGRRRPEKGDLGRSP
jgi:TetR/AcrR family transcriptional regulator, transcriptional repressor for nem operon